MAPLDVSSDLSTVLSELGVQVVLGSDTTFGIVRGRFVQEDAWGQDFFDRMFAKGGA